VRYLNTPVSYFFAARVKLMQAFNIAAAVCSAREACSAALHSLLIHLLMLRVLVQTYAAACHELAA
jgi:hypothetical protein